MYIVPTFRGTCCGLPTSRRFGNLTEGATAMSPPPLKPRRDDRRPFRGERPFPGGHTSSMRNCASTTAQHVGLVAAVQCRPWPPALSSPFNGGGVIYAFPHRARRKAQGRPRQTQRPQSAAAAQQQRSDGPAGDVLPVFVPFSAPLVVGFVAQGCADWMPVARRAVWLWLLANPAAAKTLPWLLAPLAPPRTPCGGRANVPSPKAIP